jgi:GTP-binding protein EngB required for normal cell division
MTLEELKSLRFEEVVVFTKVDKLMTKYHEYEVGDELEFMNIYTEDQHGRNVVNFYRKVPGEMGVIAHFSYSVCDYIERKVLLERDKKLNNLGI